MHNRDDVYNVLGYAVANTSQTNLQETDRVQRIAKPMSTLATITKVYSDRMTCDTLLLSGMPARNVPVLSLTGVIAGDSIYGKLDLPGVGDTVIVIFIEGNEGMPVITGNITPYINSKFQSAQKPINSDSKSFTKKLLEPNLVNTYRRIFRSGTTVEVQEDGTLLVETPAGHQVTIDGSGGGVNITDANGNVFEMGASSVTINSNFEVLQ